MIIYVKKNQAKLNIDESDKKMFVMVEHIRVVSNAYRILPIS